MCESGGRAWHFYMDDMIGFAEKVLAYTEGFDEAAFVAGGAIYDATLRNLELIGEAATHVPQEVRAMYSDIPWRIIVALRNKLIHGYLGIDDDTVWSVVQDDVPKLLSQLREAKGKGWDLS